MKHFNRIFWGLSFIAVAVLIILTQMNLITMNFSMAQVVLGILAIVFLCVAVSDRNIGGIFVPIGLIWIGFGEMLGLPVVPIWVVIVTMILFAIGFEIIFPKKKHINYANREEIKDDGFHDNKYQEVSDEENDGHVFCSNRFGALAKYITVSNLKKAELKNSFGEMKVYLDQAQVAGDTVEISVNNSFGEMQLYIPSDWSVRRDVSVFAGACNDFSKEKNVGGVPEVHLVGSVSFGEVRIHYV